MTDWGSYNVGGLIPSDNVARFGLVDSRPPKTTIELISEVCDEIKDFLQQKNRKYGDSAVNPLRIFSKANAVEQINVRLDDKLSRMLNRQDDDDEDVDLDLIGYLILKIVAIKARDENL